MLGKVGQGQVEAKTKNRGANRAYIAASAASAAASIPSLGIVKFMKKVSELNEGDIMQIKDAAQKGLTTSGLKDKGTIITHIENKPMQEVLDNITNLQFSEIWKEGDEKALDAITNELKNSKKGKKIIEYAQKCFTSLDTPIDNENITKEIAKCVAMPVKMGSNACYLPNANAVVTPTKALTTSVFHEMGHALNATGGKFLKGLQKMRPVAMILPSLILLNAVFNKHKAGEEKSDNKVKAALDTAKDHAGLLTGLSMAPMLIEEGIASLRGQKIAKGLVESGDLTKDLFKKVKATNLAGFASYGAKIAGAVLAVKVAIKVKDTIQAKYEAKQAQKLATTQG